MSAAIVEFLIPVLETSAPWPKNFALPVGWAQHYPVPFELVSMLTNRRVLPAR
jgi:hypothetical protein